jgi:hypothetical protein
VLPPHLGDPTKSGDLSPYRCSIIDLCHKFAISKERKEILLGLVHFRLKMVQHGVHQGFQWIDGSFVENIEVSENRPPNDIDVVTFYGGISVQAQTTLATNFPEFSKPSISKQTYKIDHYAVDYSYMPDFTVEITRYWIQLFTHNRNGIWKGIIRLPLNTPAEDQQALLYLNSLSI